MAAPLPLIYLDHHATTPCDPRVLEAMRPYFSQHFGNPSSGTHARGREASKAVRRARGQVAALLGALPSELIFTAGATEANNLAILGLARGHAGPRRRLVISAIEHKAISEPCKVLADEGFEVVQLPVDRAGVVSMAAAQQSIDAQTLLVSVQAANNEVGVIQDIQALAALAHDRGALFHTDAAQAVGKLAVDVVAWDVDLLSLSGHKFYGPKGVGVLYIRGGPSMLPLKPLLLGGGHEGGLRAGTQNVPAIVGLGEACVLASQEWQTHDRHLRHLRQRLRMQLEAGIPGLVVNGPGDEQRRLAGNLSISLPKVDGEALIIACRRLCLSTGSACTSGAIEPSTVLQAMGRTRDDAHRVIRIGLGKDNTEAEIDATAALLIAEHTRLTDQMG